MSLTLHYCYDNLLYGRTPKTHLPSQGSIMAKKPRAPEEIIEVPLDQIRPFPGQPRTFFDPEELQKLAESIKLSGQLQPGMVIPVKQIGKDGVRYELVDGERR